MQSRFLNEVNLEYIYDTDERDLFNVPYSFG